MSHSSLLSKAFHRSKLSTLKGLLDAGRVGSFLLGRPRADLLSLVSVVLQIVEAPSKSGKLSPRRLLAVLDLLSIMLSIAFAVDACVPTLLSAGRKFYLLSVDSMEQTGLDVKP